VPWERVFGTAARVLSPTQRFAASIVFGEFDGGSFSFETLSWKRKDTH
jgi:hypothetical protein